MMLLHVVNTICMTSTQVYSKLLYVTVSGLSRLGKFPKTGKFAKFFTAIEESHFLGGIFIEGISCKYQSNCTPCNATRQYILCGVSKLNMFNCMHWHISTLTRTIGEEKKWDLIYNFNLGKLSNKKLNTKNYIVIEKNYSDLYFTKLQFWHIKTRRQIRLNVKNSKEICLKMK